MGYNIYREKNKF